MSQSISEGYCPFHLGQHRRSLSENILPVYGEIRTGKTQLAHTMSVIAQLPSDLGGAQGKVIMQYHSILLFDISLSRSHTSTRKVRHTDHA